MTTLSVPISAVLEEFIQSQVKLGKAANKADVVRKAIVMLREHEAIQEVLDARKEQPLRGDLKELAKKFRNA